MKYLLFAFFSITIIIASCSSSNNEEKKPSSEVKKPTPPANTSTIVHMTPQEFQAKMNELSNEQLVDVRTSGEVANGFIENSINYDFNGNTFNEQIKGLKTDQPVMVYCAGGGRSKKAANAFKALGIKEIYELDNGFSAWSSAGLPVKQ